jgi:zinc transport system permease protein
VIRTLLPAVTIVVFLMSAPVVFADPGAGTPPADPAAAAHSVHDKHKHQHGGKDCKHKAEKHGSHVDYEDDGHHHKKDGEHWDECDGPEKDAKK